MSWVLLLLYTIIIFYTIYKLKFFRLEGLGRWTPSLFFLLKIIAGIALWYVYTYYYTDRSTSDIWKYFDDGKVMFGAIHSHPGDFFRMLSGIGDHTPEIDALYYHKMNYWYRLFDNNLLNDAHIVIRFNAFVNLFSMGNYFTHMLIMCFLSFTGLTCIHKIVYPAIREWRAAAGAILFLLPSLVFWTSGVMKEGIMIFGLGILIYQTFRFFTDKKPIRILFMLIGAALLLFSKFYVIVGVIPPLVGAILVMKNRENATLKFLLVFILFFFMGYSLKWIAPEREPLRLLANKQNDFMNVSRGGITLVNDSIEVYFPPTVQSRTVDIIRISDSTFRIRNGATYFYRPYRDLGDTVFVTDNKDSSIYRIQTDIPLAGSLMKSTYLKPTIFSFLHELPRSLFHALFRPFLWEAKNPMFILPALENLIFVILVLLALFFRRKISNPEVFGFCLTFSILLFMVMGLTTPVLGALVRYRIVAQPFLLLAVLLLIDRQKFMKRFPRLEKLGI
jgi:hypothetical protein